MGRTSWTGEHQFVLDGVRYRSMVGGGSGDEQLLLKPRSLVEAYEATVAELAPRRLIELGMYRGGGAALLYQLAAPEKLVVIDLDPGPCPPLEQFIDDHSARGRLVPFYGVDQSDVERLEAIVREQFAGPIDLVIDDASHLLDPTRASFHRLFPHVRPGGLYIIEDWGWPHVPPDREAHDMYRDVAPVSAFVCEVVLAAAYRRRAIEEIVITSHWAAIRRGDADLRPGVFDLREPGNPLAREMVDRLGATRTPG